MKKIEYFKSDRKNDLSFRYINSDGFSGFQEFEILELLLNYVHVKKDCTHISKLLINEYGNLYNIIKTPLSDLRKNKNLNNKSAIFLNIFSEVLEKNVLYKNIPKNIKITTDKEVIDYLKFSMASHNIEIFKIIFLNTQNEIIKDENIFFGTIDRSNVYIREILKKILKYNSKSVILVHNHPSGSLKPSKQDITITKKIEEGLNIIDAKVLDHIIISKNGYFSFLEGGLI